MSAPAQDLADLLARSACAELATRAYRLIDTGRASEATALFTEDGRFEVESLVAIEGREALTTFFAAREAQHDRRTRHCLVDGLWRRLGEAEAEQEATLLLFVLGDDAAAAPVRALAEVRDRFRLEAGTWRIAERFTRPLAGRA